MRYDIVLEDLLREAEYKKGEYDTISLTDTVYTCGFNHIPIDAIKIYLQMHDELCKGLLSLGIKQSSIDSLRPIGLIH